MATRRAQAAVVLLVLAALASFALLQAPEIESERTEDVEEEIKEEGENRLPPKDSVKLSAVVCGDRLEQALVLLRSAIMHAR
jgi:hypothetical protein